MEDEEKNRLRAGWSHHEESRVHHSPGCRNDLASSSVERLLSDDCIQDLKLHIPDGWGQQKHWVMATDHWWGITHFLCAKCLMLPMLDFPVRGKEKRGDRTYAHHREGLPWCPTGNPEQCCLWLSRAAPCPPTEGKTRHRGVRSKT